MPTFEQFIQERIYLQNVSPRTVDWYRQTFKWLERFPLTEQGLKDLIVGMRQAGLQAVSCNSRLRWRDPVSYRKLCENARTRYEEVLNWNETVKHLRQLLN